MKVTHFLTALAVSACLSPAAMARGKAPLKSAHVKTHVSGKTAKAEKAKPGKTRGKRVQKPAVEA